MPKRKGGGRPAPQPSQFRTLLVDHRCEFVVSSKTGRIKRLQKDRLRIKEGEARNVERIQIRSCLPGFWDMALTPNQEDFPGRGVLKKLVCAKLEASDTGLDWYHHFTRVGNGTFSGQGVNIGIIDVGKFERCGDLEHVEAWNIRKKGGPIEIAAVERPKNPSHISHAEYVTRLIAGKPKNAHTTRGRIGIAPGAKTTVYALRPEAGGSAALASEISRAMDRLIDYHKVDIINLSAGWIPVRSRSLRPEIQTPSEQMRIQLKRAHDKGVLVFASVGNAFPEDTDKRMLFPASDPYCWSVAAGGLLDVLPKNTDARRILEDHVAVLTTPDALKFHLPAFNCGDDEADLVAPGVGLIADDCWGTPTHDLSGTSFACAVATGTAAIALQKARIGDHLWTESIPHGSMQNPTRVVRACIERSHDERGSGYNLFRLPRQA